jgi:L-fucose isomerase
MGGMSMGIAGSVVNAAFLEKYLGMRMESVDMSEFVRRWDEKIYDPEEFELAKAWVKEYVRIGFDKNPEKAQHSAEKKAKVMEQCILMTMIARDLMQGNEKLKALGFGEEAMGHNALAGGFQGQRQWTDHFPNGDFMEAMLNSSFDWNGVREAFPVATENDSLNGVCMLFGHLLTGTAQVFADVRTYWSPEAIKRVTGQKPTGAAANGMIHLINSGAAAIDACGELKKDGKAAMKPFWEITPEEAAKCMEAVEWAPASVGYFRGGGYSSSFGTRADMPATMMRLNWVKGLGPVLQIAEGQFVDVPAKIYEKLEERTDPTWPTHWFVPNLTGKGPFTDVYSVMNAWGANHGAISYGHIGADLITLAAMLRIPVFMHNVAEEKIFRPAAWNSFGTNDPEGADQRACANFGPLYRKF